jgi:hypothetical protein
VEIVPDETVDPFGVVDVQPGDIAPAGEIAYVNVTEDPNVGMFFDEIHFVRAGGPNNTVLDVYLFQDGSLLLDGQLVRNVGPNTVIEVNNRIDELNLMNMTGSFAATVPNRNDFLYSLNIKRGGVDITIQADDTLVPSELRGFFTEIIQIAENTPEQFRAS